MSTCRCPSFALLLVAASSLACVPRAEPPGPGFVDALPTWDAPPGLHVRAHAHNDYLHERPLLDALDARFYSVEADIYPSGEGIVVAHFPWEVRGTLKDLYLDPLEEILKARGSVHGDGYPFTLWIDLKDGSANLRDELHALLSQYDFITTFTDDVIEERAVTVVLTGDAASKTAYVEDNATRLACRDSNDFDDDDPAADFRWRYYALPWSEHISWNGGQDVDATTLDAMSSLVGTIHDKGRALRFYAAPDTERAWSASVQAGVDFIHTDDLEGLSAFLESGGS